MSHASLAARYRPQSFAEVTGQDMIKTILSRAAAQDKIAPAYLLSGTRGVGKTTIARIFAKALNCIQAPTAEPCNVCEQCKSITQGSHVDVVEIDGASNTGVDDARKLKESIGYAPMEGRYKVFIIDEAHMLSRNAFNALLKTLEEPPARAVFIMATTEPHKFPPTIISRCQHFIFQAQPEQELTDHLKRILGREKIEYEDAAVRLIARRASGSVRDAMSLLGQTLALGGQYLNNETTRQVLGVAGLEAYEQLLTLIHKQDSLGIAKLTRDLLNRGIDIGFFLKELTVLWRNLFLIRQSSAGRDFNQDLISVLDVPEDEQKRLAILAELFSLTYIHAAWHMMLDSQRQILNSLEPATSLELLLLNLGMLPRLVGLDILGTRLEQDDLKKKITAQPDNSENKKEAVYNSQNQPQKAEKITTSTPENTSVKQNEPNSWTQAVQTAPKNNDSFQANAVLKSVAMPTEQAELQNSMAALGQVEKKSAPQVQEFNWNDMVALCESNKAKYINPQRLRQIQGELKEQILYLRTFSLTLYQQMLDDHTLSRLQDLCFDYTGQNYKIKILPPEKPIKTEGEVLREMAEHPIIKNLQQNLQADLLRCKPSSKPVNQTISGE